MTAMRIFSNGPTKYDRDRITTVASDSTESCRRDEEKEEKNEKLKSNQQKKKERKRAMTLQHTQEDEKKRNTHTHIKRTKSLSNFSQ